MYRLSAGGTMYPLPGRDGQPRKPAATGKVAAEAEAMGGKAIECPSPLNVPKYTYDHSCY
jgi:hypothetical protein